MSATKVKRRTRRVTLRTAARTLRVDGRIIHDVAVIQAGEALGHGFIVDDVMLRQVVNAIDKAGSMPLRVTHCETIADPLPATVGLVKDARVVGDTVRADLHLMESSPYSEFILELAKTQPTALGCSVEFDPRFEVKDGVRFGRIAKLFGVALVAEPASVRNGLLSIQKENMTMTPKQIAELRSLLGLPKEATIEEILAAVGALVDDDTAPADNGDGDGEPTAMSVKTMRAANRVHCQRVRTLAASLHLPERWALSQIESGADFEQVKVAAKTEVERLSTVHNVYGANVEIGENLNVTSLTTGIGDALVLKMRGKVENPSRRAKLFSVRPVAECAREYLRAAGEPMVDEMTPSRLFERVRRVRLAQSTSDFDGLLGDSVARVLRQAYEQVEPNWSKCFGRHVLKDFRSAPLIGFHPAGDLTARDEGGGIDYQALTEEVETVQLREYVGGCKITRQALVNDDLGAFATVFPKLADAARRQEDTLAFAVLAGSQEMADGQALFASHASGANYIASGSGAPSVTTIAACVALLRRQSANGAVLNLSPAFLIAPAELEAAARQACGPVDPDGTNEALNPWGDIEPIIEPRLADASEWYIAANPARIDTIGVFFLQGEETPVLRQETDFDTEDVKFAVRHSVASRALDWRGLVKTVGTA